MHVLFDTVYDVSAVCIRELELAIAQAALIYLFVVINAIVFEKILV